jgi:hypothetical protein
MRQVFVPGCQLPFFTCSILILGIFGNRSMLFKKSLAEHGPDSCPCWNEFEAKQTMIPFRPGKFRINFKRLSGRDVNIYCAGLSGR